MIRGLRVCLIAAAVLITVLEFFGARDFSRAPFTGIFHHNLIIQAVDRNGPNAGLDLDAGDRIVEVDGVQPRNLNHFNYLTVSNVLYEPQTYVVARGDSLFEVTVKNTHQPQARIDRKVALMIVGFTFILVGFIVIMKRPDILGMLFAVNFFILSFLVTARPVTSIHFFHIAGELVYDFCFIFLPAFFIHFSLIFPGREIVRGMRRFIMIRYIYLSPAILFLFAFAAALASYSHGMNSAITNSLESFTAFYWVAYMVASLVTFVRTYVTSERVHKIKFRIVTVGLALGILPLSAVMIIKQLSPTMEIPYGHVSVIFLSFISISFAYAILKHDAFDLGIVIRKGLSFVILSALLISIYYLLVNVLGTRLGGITGIRPSFITITAIVLLALVVVPARAGVQRFIDSAFKDSRKVFRAQVIEFSRSIQHLLSPEEIVNFVAFHMKELSAAQYVHVFLKDDGETYNLLCSLPADARLPLTSFPATTALIELMRERGSPLMVEYLDKLWIKSNMDRISIELLSLSRAAVAVPLIEQHEFLGFILVGRRTTGRPYSGADAEVFELLSERSAAAIRSIELYRDSIRKEKLEEELQLASAIQRRLLPETPPALRNAVICGGIRTSREVGGDFYDFVELAPQRIGVAVADVSGKGIPAAMLMTTLQASFRAEALQDRPPADVLASLNRSLFERSDTAKFATFFYATYDDATGIFRYSNAGSFPPIVFRSDGRISRLLRGGILVGVVPDSIYQEGIIKLRAGDLVVMYTDGFIDQEDKTGTPYGEKNIIDFLRNNSDASVESLIEKLFATVIAFGQNNVKDDMTIVLLRKMNN